MIYKEGTDYKPTPANPLVYHLHGDIDYPNSMVLTEKDYTDFVIFLNKEAEKNVLPSSIRKPLTRKKLLFIGYNLDEAEASLAFSVIFQTVISSSPPKHMQKIGIAVQAKLRTDNNTANYTSVNVDKVEKYLEQYTNKVLSLDVYWGDSSIFSEELRHQLNIFSAG